MRPISPGDGYVCLLDSKRPVFRWQLAMVIQPFIHAYLEDGNELFLHCCMRMAGPWWRLRQNLTGWVFCAFVCVCVCVWAPSILSIYSLGWTDFSLTLVLHPHTHPSSSTGNNGTPHLIHLPVSSCLTLFFSCQGISFVYFGCLQLNGLLYYWWLNLWLQNCHPGTVKKSLCFGIQEA